MNIEELKKQAETEIADFIAQKIAEAVEYHDRHDRRPGRGERRPRSQLHISARLIYHAAPLGVRLGNADAEEGEERFRENRARNQEHDRYDDGTHSVRQKMMQKNSMKKMKC